ncbi:MAG: ABC transporter ATP-binding protein [Thermomicrobiales bacterium]
MIEVEHVSKVFTYANPNANSNSQDMWVDYLLSLLGRKNLFHGASKGRTVAVEDVSFDVRAGEFFGLLGPNGAGKSTLVKIISTILAPTTGTIRIAGYDVQRQPAEARASLSVVPSGGWLSFDSHISVDRNLAFWGRLFGLDAATTTVRAREALLAVGLEDQGATLPMAFSSGMRQRLAIAKGLLSLTPCFVLDEPTANVDPISAADIQEFIRTKLNRELGQTVLMTTHNMTEAERLCDRVAIVHRGLIVACDTPSALLAARAKRVAEIGITTAQDDAIPRLRDHPAILRLQEFPTETGTTLRILLGDGNDQRDLVTIASGIGLEPNAIHAIAPSLEDVFFDVTRGMPEPDAPILEELAA